MNSKHSHILSHFLISGPDLIYKSYMQIAGTADVLEYEPAAVTVGNSVSCVQFIWSAMMTARRYEPTCLNIIGKCILPVLSMLCSVVDLQTPAYQAAGPPGMV